MPKGLRWAAAAYNVGEVIEGFMKLALLLTLGVLLAIFPAAGQAPKTPPAGDPDFASQRGPAGSWERDQLKKLQDQQKAERQKLLKADTDKLLALATELKDQVDKTNQNVLSLDVVRKAEEIEKLAKHIKTNMRDQMR
jgi:hypothetical protein